MRRARILIITALVLILGVVAGYFVSRGLESGSGRAQQTQVQQDIGFIVIAAQDIPLGAKIKPDDIVSAPFPADSVVETMVTDPRQVIGLWAIQDIARGVPITEGMVTTVERNTVPVSEGVCSPTSPDVRRSCPPADDKPAATMFEARPCREVFPDDEDIAQWESEASPLAIYLGDLPPGLDPPIRFGHATCGWVKVRSHHAWRTRPEVSLAVLILPATGTNPEPDPLFWAQGGPGGSTVSDLKWLAHDSPLRVDRDMVLFDQRGTGHSVPSLDCPEWETAGLSASENDITPQEAEEIQLRAIAACRRRLEGAGAPLSDFNTRENAADVEDIRLALGYDKVNLYGVSYGTELALNVMRSFPASLRSVILDSVVPPQVNVETEAYRSFDHALTELFDACRVDAECRQAYPNLEQTYSDLSARLSASPVAVRVVDPVKRRGFEIDLTADRLNGILFGTFYDAEQNIPLLPAFIGDLSTGARELMSTVLWENEDSFSEGMYLSTSCADGFNVDVSGLRFSDIRSPVAASADTQAAWMERVCAEWGVPDLGSKEDWRVVSDVPTLLVTGRYDPITPTSYADLAAKTLLHSAVVEFPNVGHGVVDSSDCANDVFSRFLSHPAGYLDTTCVGEIPAFDFVLPDSVTPLSWGTILLGYFEGRTVSRGVVGLAAAALVMMVVVAPVWLTWGALRESLRARKLSRKILRRWRRISGAHDAWWARNFHKLLLADLVALMLVGAAIVLSVKPYIRLAVSSGAWGLNLAITAYAALTVCLAVGARWVIRSPSWTRRRKALAVIFSASATLLLLLLLGGFAQVFAL